MKLTGGVSATARGAASRNKAAIVAARMAQRKQ
jgi:hypothetical protein